MATYKVIQDIEAEDKFLGPLTLKQFVFGAVGLFFGYLNIFALSRGYGYAMVVFLPPTLIGLFLAVPWSRDQPTEVWVLAKLKYYFKPRKRIWNQSGMEELVTITAPKKEEKPLTDNLSKGEVKSRLEILAEVIDSRGWAIKDNQAQNLIQPEDSVDRLISPAVLPKEVPIVDLASIPDVYDESARPSENFDLMMQQSANLRKAQNLETMNQVRSGQPLPTAVGLPTQFTPPPTDYQTFANLSPKAEKALSEELKSHQTPTYVATSHMRTIQPLDPNAIAQNRATAVREENLDQIAKQTMPPTPDPDIIKYAGNNDLDVATIARQAKKETDGDADEVVISLH